MLATPHARSIVTVIIGTSGWQYADWRPRFYSAKMAQSRWLGFYAERFSTVEVNNTFYRLPERQTFQRWRESVPDDFVVAIKANRYLTHVRRLRDPGPVSTLMERASGLGKRLGPVLLQLPPNLRSDPAALDATLVAFGGRARVAVEVRHESWFSDEVRRVLEARGAALCLVDGGPVEVPLWRTADWAYVRFHGGKGRPRPCYRRAEVAAWADRLAGSWTRSEDVYCYFNNDTGGCALRDARWMAKECARAGLPATRVPKASETRVG